MTAGFRLSVWSTWNESAGIETYFRDLTRSPHSTTKDWADYYLAPFAVTSRLTVVTFDRAFKHKTKELVLLKAKAKTAATPLWIV